MKKLKKSLKNKKPTVILVCGPIAVGKFTVAQILSKKLKYKLVHNHYLNDFVWEIFGHSLISTITLERLRYIFLENAVKAGINFVTTHTYTHNYVSRTGLSDPDYIKTLEKKLTKAGANFYLVHLKAEKEELLKRVNVKSRRKFKKLVNKKIMRNFLKNKDWSTSPKIKNNLIIDNTKISSKKVADMIIKHFKIK